MYPKKYPPNTVEKQSRIPPSEARSSASKKDRFYRQSVRTVVELQNPSHVVKKTYFENKKRREVAKQSTYF